ncbi:MAG: family 10 glycosylhydrolase [Verrucomicrobia bacterium]|nr:family 10 glycosylhydrolase [Verrucomicrobiota bacterium]
MPGIGSPAAVVNYATSTVLPPKPNREFRGAWVASVSNIDWPSQPGLSTAQQKAELVAILNRAAQLHLNAIILQVRPACDALYSSQLEPWSEYLTGTMGRPPSPYYDPLDFAVAEAHKRGLELHAWFNPFRARQSGAKSLVSAKHISRTRPELVRQYGKLLWLDPGEREVQDHSLRVVMDVVKRYDIDGVHFDDYFYPERGSTAGDSDFPDDRSWRRFGTGGRLSREDWRRENVNTFIQRVYQSTKATKPWVKFGISPFGIWRPKNPAQIRGKDAYAELYADSRKWLANGWVDYFAPQLYWAIQPPEQSYPVLLKWWAEQNPKGRHLWPGMDATKVGGKWTAEEIVKQVRLTRKQTRASGEIFWDMKSLMENRGRLASTLENDLFAQPALVPASPWLDRQRPGKPKLYIANHGSTGAAALTWADATTNKVWLWVVQTRKGGSWSTVVLPGNQTSRSLDRASTEMIAVSAVNRYGNLSYASVLERKVNPAK